MAGGEAYCVEAKENITLRAAHDRYFAQPEDKRKRLGFMCGDPKCRAVARPKVVGAYMTGPMRLIPMRSGATGIERLTIVDTSGPAYRWMHLG